MNLYQIDQAILQLVDEETGEILDWEAFDALQMERETKIENVACWYKNLKAEAAAIKAEEDNLKKRREALVKQAETKLRYLENALQGQNFKTAKCSITFRKNPPAVQLHEPALAIAWAMSHGRGDLVTIVPPEISKKGLLELLKDGHEIPGAAMTSGMSMGVK